MPGEHKSSRTEHQHRLSRQHHQRGGSMKQKQQEKEKRNERYAATGTQCQLQQERGPARPELVGGVRQPYEQTTDHNCEQHKNDHHLPPRKSTTPEPKSRTSFKWFSLSICARSTGLEKLPSIQSFFWRLS